jgi:uncharacterized integral membrane protein (TIGR00697 family)
MTREYKALAPITALFVATLLIANTLDTKIFHLGGLDLPAGIVIFPLAYLFGDVLTEVYGYAIARRTIWTGFLALILMVVSYELARALPPASFWPNQSAFDAVFSHVPRIVAASMLAYFCGEFVNSYIVAKMKVSQSGDNMGLRFVVSTIAGQAIDTAVFVVVAFGGVMPTEALVSVFVSGWLVKVVWEVVALPITLPAVRMLKRVENEDAFDRSTDFNPFRLR